MRQPESSALHDTKTQPTVRGKKLLLVYSNSVENKEERDGQKKPPTAPHLHWSTSRFTHARKNSRKENVSVSNCAPRPASAHLNNAQQERRAQIDVLIALAIKIVALETGQQYNLRALLESELGIEQEKIWARSCAPTYR